MSKQLSVETTRKMLVLIDDWHKHYLCILRINANIQSAFWELIKAEGDNANNILHNISCFRAINKMEEMNRDLQILLRHIELIDLNQDQPHKTKILIADFVAIRQNFSCKWRKIDVQVAWLANLIGEIF